MNPSKWGSQAWTFLHAVTFVYPENPTEAEKKQYYDFFMSLKNVIPCIKCRKHYEQHISELPLRFHLETRDSLISWLHKIHNKVNESLGKPQFDIKNIEEIFDKSCVTNTYLTISIILIGILVVIGFYFYMNRNKMKGFFNISN